MRALSMIFAIAVTLGACGGGPSDSPPGPLSRRFDDMYIADIGLDQKQNVVTAQNDWAKAKMENAHAESRFNESTVQLSVVNNDRKAAQLKVDSAISNKKSAEASADTNRMNQAQKDLHNAELAVKAAAARVKYFEAYRAYLKQQWRYTQENMYWRESQYELAKAQLAQQHNKAPKGVSYDWYPKQEAERNKRTAVARDKSETHRGRASTARDTWLKQQQLADQASGAPANWPDPMAPVQPTTAGTSGTSAAPPPSP